MKLRLKTFVCLFTFLVLTWASDSKLYRRLLYAAKRSDEARVSELLREVGKDPSARLVRLLLELGVKTRSRKLYLEVRKALANITGQEGLNVLGEAALRNRVWQYRIFSLIALADNKDSSTAKYLIPLLKDKDLRIRIRAAEALANKGSKEVVDALIAVLPEADRISPEFSLAVRRSLFSLTGQNISSAGDWANWWRAVRASWKPLPLQGRGKTVVSGIKPPGNFPKFFGIEILSLRVVFVIDVSGSMEEPVEGSQIPKIELVKKELTQLVKELRRKARFTIVAFSDKIIPLSRKLLPATPANKLKAIRFVSKLKAGGYTWTKEALEKAFSYRDANTVVLLSDGTPCKKGYPPIPVKPILDWVALVNRFRGLTIHCVGFRGAYVPFLRTLALENGGVYRNARVSQGRKWNEKKAKREQPRKEFP